MSQPLPPILQRAISDYEKLYDNGGSWRTVTSLMSGPREYLFQASGDANLVSDQRERLRSFSGSATHEFIERAAGPSDIVEVRVFTEIDGKVISGKFDHIGLDEPGYGQELRTVMRDWKETTTKSFMKNKGRAKAEHEAQLNMLLWLIVRLREGSAWHDGDPDLTIPIPDVLEVFYIYSDFSPFKKLFGRGYPPEAGLGIRVEEWPHERTEAYIRERIAIHAQFDGKSPLEAPICSDKETWAGKDEYALRVTGRKTAVKLFDSLAEGRTWLQTDGKNYQSRNPTFEHRPALRVKCAAYCAARHICPQGQEAQDAAFQGK